jgi:hypothetical protein
MMLRINFGMRITPDPRRFAKQKPRPPPFCFVPYGGFVAFAKRDAGVSAALQDAGATQAAFNNKFDAEQIRIYSGFGGKQEKWFDRRKKWQDGKR